MLDISPKFHYKSFALPWAGLYPFVIVFYCNLPFMHAVAMDRILLVAVALCLLFFGPAGTNGGRFRPLKDQADPSPSVNESYSIRQLIDHVSPLADNQSGAPVTYFAVHETGPEAPDGYYGFIATMDVYGLSLSPEQLSLASFWMVNAGDGKISSLNNIQIGWEVSPYLYGDSRTHFFVIWTSDGFQETGCYNMKCPGFKPETGASIVPGDIIDPVSQPNGAKQNITLKVLKRIRRLAGALRA